jgi:hypothetical protein
VPVSTYSDRASAALKAAMIDMPHLPPTLDRQTPAGESAEALTARRLSPCQLSEPDPQEFP